jgi:type IV conjugative transfer system protein TraE
MLLPRRSYLSRLDALVQNNRLMGVALVVMLLFNLMNWTALFHARHDSRVALVPMVGGTGLWVGAGRASDSYLRAMARYITAQLGDYTAGSYRAQLQELLQLFPPEDVGAVHAQFMQLAGEVERYPSIASSVQWLGKQPLKVQGDLIQVHVRKSRWVDGAEVDAHSSYYCIRYRIDDTRFRVLGVEEIQGEAQDLCLLQHTNAKPASTPPVANAAPPASKGSGV